jgi:hypothetical protein
VIVYIIDSSTGEVLDSQRVEGKASSGGIGIDYAYKWVSFGGTDFKRTPLGKATQMTIDRAVEYIAGRLASVPWSGNVAKVEGNMVYLNAGQNAGIVQGEAFKVWREEEALTDPVTGASLGGEKSRIGDVIVAEVQDKFSKAAIQQSSGEIKRGDLVTE